MSNYEEILNFWFGNTEKEHLPDENKNTLWFTKSETIDKEIRDNFLDDVEAALNNLYTDWQDTPESTLALIILLDQFTRNIFRDTPRAFDGDNMALQTSLIAIEKGFDKQFNPVKRVFFYMPLEHSENIDIQKKCLNLFSELVEDSPPELKQKVEFFKDYAQKHLDIIARFGRFPHRNTILNRNSTPEEIEFLKQPGSGF